MAPIIPEIRPNRRLPFLFGGKILFSMTRLTVFRSQCSCGLTQHALTTAQNGRCHRMCFTKTVSLLCEGWDRAGTLMGNRHLDFVENFLDFFDSTDRVFQRLFWHMTVRAAILVGV